GEPLCVDVRCPAGCGGGRHWHRRSHRRRAAVSARVRLSMCVLCRRARRYPDRRAGAPDSCVSRVVEHRRPDRLAALRERRAHRRLDPFRAVDGAPRDWSAVIILQRAVVLNALSVDVEEYFHAEIFRNGTGSHGARTFESRVEASVDLLLKMLGTRTRGTFFTLGEIAAKHPALVRTIAGRGHEIACHGDRHECIYRLS